MRTMNPALVVEVINNRRGLAAALRAQSERINERLALANAAHAFPHNTDEDGYPRNTGADVYSTGDGDSLELRRRNARAKGYWGPLTRVELAALAFANTEVG